MIDRVRERGVLERERARGVGERRKEADLDRLEWYEGDLERPRGGGEGLREGEMERDAERRVGMVAAGCVEIVK